MSKKTVEKSVPLRAASTRTLKLGLLSCKVGTGPAYDDAARVSGKMLDPDDLRPVKQRWLTEAGEIIERSQCVTGYEYGDSFVVLDKDEKPDEVDGDGSIALTHCVESIPPELVTKTAFIWPAEKTSDDAYALLAHYLRGSGRTFIGETVAQGTTKVVAVRWSDPWECVVMHTLVYDAQVRYGNLRLITEGVDTIPLPDPKMASMAGTLFATLPDEFDYSEVQDEYGNLLAEAIEAKAEGLEITREAPSTGADVTNDIMAALTAMAAQVQS